MGPVTVQTWTHWARHFRGEKYSQDANANRVKHPKGLFSLKESPITDCSFFSLLSSFQCLLILGERCRVLGIIFRWLGGLSSALNCACVVAFLILLGVAIMAEQVASAQELLTGHFTYFCAELPRQPF